MAHSSHLAITRIPNSANRHPFRILECNALSNVYVHSKEKETANKVARSVKYVFLGNANSYVVVRFSVIKYAGGGDGKTFSRVSAKTERKRFIRTFVCVFMVKSCFLSAIKPYKKGTRCCKNYFRNYVVNQFNPICVLMIDDVCTAVISAAIK